MESRAKVLGHPVHPMLIVFPLGLLVTSVIFDIIHLATGSELATQVAFWNIGAGVIGGLLAAVFGLVDYLSIPAGTRAKAVGSLHGIGNAVVTLLFAASWLLRRDNPGAIPGTVELVLSVGGLILGVFTAWLGGELVDRMGVGVDRGAHLNSPSSLSSQPAAHQRTDAHSVGGDKASRGDKHSRGEKDNPRDKKSKGEKAGKRRER